MKNPRKAKIALVHDKLQEYGGAERVFVAITQIFPKADIYTSLFDHTNQNYKSMKGRIKKYWKKIPLFNNNLNLLKPLINLYWERLDFSTYDIVISSSHSFSSKSIITKPETIHICYCHTPPKFLYPEVSESDFHSNVIITPLKSLLFSFMRVNDFIAAQRPDLFIVNSKTVQYRIKKYYRRSSQVVYPPVTIPSNPPKIKPKKEYYITISRIYKTKGINLVVDAFNKLGEKLIIIGEGPLLPKLKKKAKKNIKFMGYTNEDEKNKLLSSAKAFVNASIDEDFGIAPVEAMAHGTPVIAYYSGGLRETIIDRKTGIFFKRHTTNSLLTAINKFESMKFDPLTCYKQASKFSEKKFKKEILNFTLKNFQ